MKRRSFIKIAMLLSACSLFVPILGAFRKRKLKGFTGFYDATGYAICEGDIVLVRIKMIRHAIWQKGIIFRKSGYWIVDIGSWSLGFILTKDFANSLYVGRNNKRVDYLR